jgi:hypothetical protein
MKTLFAARVLRIRAPESRAPRQQSPAARRAEPVCNNGSRFADYVRSWRKLTCNHQGEIQVLTHQRH